MGIFSGTHKYYAFAGSQTLQDEQPDTWKSMLIKSSLGAGFSKADALQTTLNTDQFARAKSMYRYAAKGEDPTREGGYIRGLPSSNMTLLTVDPDAVAAGLARTVGTYDSILSQYLGKYKEDFFLNAAIQAIWPDWDETAETYTLPDGTVADNSPEFIRRSSVDLGENETREIMGADVHAKFPVTPLYDGTYEAIWDYEGGSYTMDLDIKDYIYGNYIMVKYIAEGQVRYWYYEEGSDLDPVLEATIDKNEKNETFLPVAILMQDEVWFDEDAKGNLQEDTELAKTTNRLLKRLATSGTEIKADFIAQREEDLESGDAKKKDPKIWDVFIHYAVPMQTKDRGGKEYLWYFFEDLETFTTSTADDYLTYLASEKAAADGYSKPQPFSDLSISEGDTEKSVNGYNVEYKWSFIEKREYEGEFLIEDADAEGGTRPLKPKEIHKGIYERSDDEYRAPTYVETEIFGLEIDFPELRDQKPEYDETMQEFFGADVATGLCDPSPRKVKGPRYDQYGYHDIVVLTRALPAVPGSPDLTVSPGYERVVIMGLSMQYVINTKDEEHSTGRTGYNFRYAVPELFGVDEDTKEFRIPIQWSALKKMPVLHREEAVADGLCATVFLVKKIHVHWYQTGFFKWLIIIIAIILIVLAIYYAGGTGAEQGVSFIAALVAATGATGVWAFVLYVAFSFVIGWIVGVAASNIGGTLGQIFAIIAAIAFFYAGGGFSSIGESGSQLAQNPGWATASAFLQAVQPIYSMGIQVINMYTMHEVEADLRDFEKTKEEQQQELQDARDGFGAIPSWLDPMDLVTEFKRQGATEDAETYFNRVLNANPGVLGYAMVDQFAELGIRLPKEYGSPSVVEGVFLDFEEQRRQ